MKEDILGHKKVVVLIPVFLISFSILGVTATFAASTTGGNHAPIAIKSDGDFTACSCVKSGTGTSVDPYVIGPWTIMATTSDPGVLVDGSGGTITKFFVLSHITVHGTESNDGIDLVNINGGGIDTLAAINIDGAANGIFLSGVSGVTISGNSINNDFLWGIQLTNSNNNVITFMTISHNGLSNPSSHTLPLSLGVNVFLGIDVAGGVMLLHSNDNVLSRSELSEDGYTGFYLVNSNGNTVTDVHSRYPDYYGGVLQDSSGNTINKISMQTGDFVGLIIRGGADNTVTNSVFSANGPIGNEVHDLVVPYYISGIYLGWGTHDNTIEDNSANNGNTGPSLVVDDGSITNPTSSPIQSVNPFNDPSTGNDPGTVPGASVFDAGLPTAAGANLICGNSFQSWVFTGNPDSPCP